MLPATSTVASTGPSLATSAADWVVCIGCPLAECHSGRLRRDVYGEGARKTKKAPAAIRAKPISWLLVIL